MDLVAHAELEPVIARFASARNYWIASTRPDGRPHTAPVWGLWINNAFVFGTDNKSQKATNLRAQPWLIAHLESGDQVDWIEGDAEFISKDDVRGAIFDAFAAKYVVDEKPLDVFSDDLPDPVFIRVVPKVVSSWLESDLVNTQLRVVL